MAPLTPAADAHVLSASVKHNSLRSIAPLQLRQTTRSSFVIVASLSSATLKCERAPLEF